MPTFEKLPRFQRDFDRLEPPAREAFMGAVRRFITNLSAWEAHGMAGRPAFDADLRVKDVEGARSRGIWELTWQWPDGRATFQYGRQKQPGKAHVVWRRIGTHRIFREP